MSAEVTGIVLGVAAFVICACAMVVGARRLGRRSGRAALRRQAEAEAGRQEAGVTNLEAEVDGLELAPPITPIWRQRLTGLNGRRKAFVSSPRFANSHQ